MKIAILASAVVFTLALECANAAPPDYEFFKTRVQPIFLQKRKGNARCVSCHVGRTGFALAEMSPGATAWNEEQSRRNYEAASAFVVPRDPAASRLLMHPLAVEAGGDPYHSGGRHWVSQRDPEWQTLAAWVRTGTPDAPAEAQALDFEFYRTRVEPIFLNPRKGGGAALGGVACFACHTILATPMRLEPLPADGKAWPLEQSRRNFAAVTRLVVPGEPLKSRLLLQPLAPEAGGSPKHTGGKFWTSQKDPEFLVLSEWVLKGKRK
ncbi:MAG: hypothetical protein ACRD8O_08010 [Bryobacteraceae bacterium]